MNRAEYRGLFWNLFNDSAENTDFMTSTQLNELIERSRELVWNVMINMGQGYGEKISSELTITQGTGTYTLESDFKKMISVYRTDIDYESLQFNPRSGDYPDNWNLIGDLDNYFIEGKLLGVRKSENATLKYKYVRTVTALTDDSTEDPDIPDEASLAVVFWCLWAASLKEGSTERAVMWRTEYDKATDDIESNLTRSDIYTQVIDGEY
jgi:hypothetical protein